MGAQKIGNNYGTVVASGTADGNRETGFAFLFVQRNKKIHKIKQFSGKGPAVFRLQNIVAHPGVMAVERTKLIDKMGIGQETHIQNHVGVNREPVAVTERADLDDLSLIHI